MPKQTIELRRLRDFGQIINASFAFLKENFKPLITSVLIICGFFILLGTITTVFALSNTVNIYSENEYGGSSTSKYLISVFFNLFVLILSQSCIYLVTVCYISVYLQKNNTAATFAEVWGYFKYYFWRIFGACILLALIIGGAFMLCIIPSIYLFPILCLVIPIIVIENSSFGYAFNKSFKLIKENWWLTFGVIFVLWLILFITNLYIGLPLQVITAGTRFISVRTFKMPLLIFFSLLKNILQLAYIMPAIAMSMCYFNLSEEKESIGLLQRLENFGKASDDTAALTGEEF